MFAVKSASSQVPRSRPLQVSLGVWPNMKLLSHHKQLVLSGTPLPLKEIYFEKAWFQGFKSYQSSRPLLQKVQKKSLPRPLLLLISINLQWLGPETEKSSLTRPP